LWIDESAVEELEYGKGVSRLGLPGFLLRLKHDQIIHEVLSKATQVLVPNGLVVKVLTEILHGEGKCHTNKNRDALELCGDT